MSLLSRSFHRPRQSFVPPITTPMSRVTARARRAYRAHASPVPKRVRPLATSLARFASVAAMCGALVAGASSAMAATYYWDTDGNFVLNALDGTGLGGAGTWDNALLN